jgi:hypothetical protein
MRESEFDKKIKVLLRDYGYTVKDNTLIDNGVKGIIPHSIVGHFKSTLAMVEYLIPVIQENEFTNRYHKIAIY